MRRNKSEFLALLFFLLALGALVTNGFAGRIFAQEKKTDIWQELQPLGEAMDEVMQSYVREPDISKMVEGAMTGMMNALDPHSSYVSAEYFKEMSEDTEGQFDGIGVTIRVDEENKLIEVMEVIPGSPSAEVGLHAHDLILKVDGVTTKGMTSADAAKRIRGPRGTSVHLSIVRTFPDSPDKEPETLEFDIKRDKIPLMSIMESRILDGGIGYIRVGDFKKTTADELDEKLSEFSKQGMRSLVLDLRWNPGGLLDASREVSSLFLPRGTLVTYTKGRAGSRAATEDLRLFTRKDPVVPANFPIIVLVSDNSASAAEIVTGALQFWKRAIVVGQKTYGKGSVQTLIPLRKPAGAALRLTTALYYTPAEVTIDKEGIRPDVDVPMSKEEQIKLVKQMRDSYRDEPEKLRDRQNHGSVTGDAMKEGVVEDIQLQKAVEILREDADFSKLIEKYHKDTHETQVAAKPDSTDTSPEKEESGTAALPAGS